MRYILTILLLLTSLIQGQIQGGENIESDTSMVKAEFGFCLSPGPNNSIISFAIVTVKGGKIIGSRNIPLQNWMLQITGHQQSPANPEGKDLLIEHQVTDCYMQYDEIRDKWIGLECNTVEELWKLKYNTHPHYSKRAYIADPALMGWSNGNYSPTFKQVEILQQYGINWIDDYFYGENMFKLLKDIQDPQWIATYSIAK